MFCLCVGRNNTPYQQVAVLCIVDKSVNKGALLLYKQIACLCCENVQVVVFVIFLHEQKSLQSRENSLLPSESARKSPLWGHSTIV